MSNIPLRLLICTEKLESELLIGIMRALRILPYEVLLFMYSALILQAIEAFVSNSKEMLEIVYDASGFDAVITPE